jgi:hypothetical protein
MKGLCFKKIEILGKVIFQYIFQIPKSYIENGMDFSNYPIRLNGILQTTLY